jgi:hypothetical protein
LYAIEGRREGVLRLAGSSVGQALAHRPPAVRRDAYEMQLRTAVRPLQQAAE